MAFLAKPDQVTGGSKLLAASNENGFSLIELFVVIAIILIMSTFAIFALMPHRNAYRTDDQALRILDFMRDAGQRAITQRQVMRLEIDQTTNVIRIIDENQVALGTADDAMVRQEALENPNFVRLYLTPAGATPPTSGGPPNSGGTPSAVTLPPAPSNFPAAVYAACLHPLTVSHSANHNGWTARFLSNGSVVNAGTNAAGTNATLTSATLYLWPPQAGAPNTAAQPQAIRAITVFGGTNAVRLWKYNGNAFVSLR
ncbi:MAG: prepilin-type N-terminal cleavage/methylation domain-containing protein [Pyrinomonadaceae bacterium]|nr:prepilin-type N-terminal cleavage/methylation domain-containing protein [Pyrinomonadaceae bacterium]